MKFAWFQTKILICVIGLFASACSPSQNRQNHGPTNAPKNQDDGSSSGGGSFGDESSLAILRWAADDLAMQIENSSPEIYKNLPAGWTKEKLAKIIRDVEPTSKNRETYRVPDVSRYGQRLMFNYGKTPEGTPFITSTKLFMDAYSHFEVNSRPKHDFYATLEEVKLKLAHETAHLMGLGVSKETDMTEARKFALGLMKALDSDNIECLPAASLPRESYPPLEAGSIDSGLDNTKYSEESPEETQRQAQEYLDEKTRAFVFNRPSGRSAQPNNYEARCRELPTNGGTTVRKCRDDERDQKYSSGHISVFAPRDYEGSFGLLSVMTTVETGQREYGFPEGYFSFNMIDLRKAVLGEAGYRSNYKYSKEVRMNDSFDDYMDYRILKTSIHELEFESFPALMQENWSNYRSAGMHRVQIGFKDGKVSTAKLVITKDHSQWFDEKVIVPEIRIEIPLNCVRSFKALD